MDYQYQAVLSELLQEIKSPLVLFLNTPFQIPKWSRFQEPQLISAVEDGEGRKFEVVVWPTIISAS